MRRQAASLLVTGLVASALACPIQRPPVPRGYYDFRILLQAAVTDTALVEMAGMSRMRARLRERLPELAAIVQVDSLLAALDADPRLSPLAGAIATALRKTLESRSVGGDVRGAFLNPDGQRLAVDAILIGLGRALHRLEERAGEDEVRGEEGLEKSG
jgi:hypothetical protein